MFDRIIFNGRLYRAYMHHNSNFANRPDHADCTWKLLETCDLDCCDPANAFDVTTAYQKDHQLNYNGHCFHARYWTKDVEDFPPPGPRPDDWYGPFLWDFECIPPPPPTCACDPAYEYLKVRDNGVSKLDEAGTKFWSVDIFHIPGQNVFKYKVEASLDTTGITVVANAGNSLGGKEVIFYHDCTDDAHGRVSGYVFQGTSSVSSGAGSYTPTGDKLFSHTYGDSGAGSITNSVHCMVSENRRTFFYESEHANLINWVGGAPGSGVFFANKITLRIHGYKLSSTTYNEHTALTAWDFEGRCKFNRNQKNNRQLIKCDSNADEYNPNINYVEGDHVFLHDVVYAANVAITPTEECHPEESCGSWTKTDICPDLSGSDSSDNSDGNDDDNVGYEGCAGYEAFEARAYEYGEFATNRNAVF